MAEIIDCSRGIGADTDYIYLGQKPPWYTEHEWKNKLKEIDNTTLSEDKIEYFNKLMAETLGELDKEKNG